MKRVLLGLIAALALGASAQAQVITSPVGCLYGVACKALSLSLSPGAATALTTDHSQASGGSTQLAFADTRWAAAGQLVTGTSIPAGDTVASVVYMAQVSGVANGAFLAAQKVIPLAMTAGFGVGQQCTDTTKPSALGAGNLIASIQANVSITLTSNIVGASMGVDDTIVCDPVVTLAAASTATISSGASINFVAAGKWDLQTVNTVPGLVLTWDGVAGSGLAISNTRGQTASGAALIFPSPVTQIYDTNVDIYRGDYGIAGVSDSTNFENYAAGGGFVFGGGSIYALSGDVNVAKITASGAAPGAGYVKMEAVAGTNAGTCKIIAYAGTSNTPVTIVDNVGAGC